MIGYKYSTNKLITILTSFYCFSHPKLAVLVSAAEECTHGMLYVSDAASSVINAFDLDQASLQDLSVVESIDTGMSEQWLQTNNIINNVILASVFRGTAASGFADGKVRFVHTGVSTESHADHIHINKSPFSFRDNGLITCARPIHYVPNDNKIAIFCDGNFGTSEEEQINSQIWVVDEELLATSTSANAIIHNSTLEGSHHGVAIPLSGNHVLHSLATDDRVNRTAGASSLPNTFQIIDLDGNPVHDINDETDQNNSCLGFHGSAAAGNAFALGCSSDHGGILVGQYVTGITKKAYLTEALLYPTTVSFDAHRTGSFADHPASSYIVGNFAGVNSFNLIAFQPSNLESNVMTESQIQVLDQRLCSYDFEKSEGEYVLTWLASGVLEVYKIEPTWSLVAEIPVMDGMTDCSQAFMVSGYGQVFVIEPETKKIRAVSLGHLDHGHDLSLETTTLDFVPFSAVVAGVPEGASCHLDDDHDDHDASAGVSVTIRASASVLALLSAVFLLTA
jgi:hypothetical protein